LSGKPLFTPEEDEEIRQIYLEGMTAQQISDILDCYKQRILCSLNRTKTKRRRGWKRASGPQSGNWKRGYRKSEEPRIMAAQKIGRELLPEEVVHHIDGNSENNNPENLEIYSNNGKHIKGHAGKWPRGKDGRWVPKED